MKKYFLAIMAIFKNEEMIIKEWIEHYLWQGVEHFYLIDNDSDDNYLKEIQPYIDKGLISIYFLPEKYKQVEHYNTVFNTIKNEMEWFIVCDIDEYFFGIEETLSDFLKKNGHQGNNIGKGWYNFGSNGYIEQPKDIRLSFTKRFADTRKSLTGGITKNIVKASIIKKLWVHEYNPIDGEYYQEIQNDEKILLFHYQLMSKEYYQKVKMSRGDVAVQQWDKIRQWQYFEERDGNEVEDLRLANLVKYGYK